MINITPLHLVQEYYITLQRKLSKWSDRLIQKDIVTMKEICNFDTSANIQVTIIIHDTTSFNIFREKLISYKETIVLFSLCEFLIKASRRKSGRSTLLEYTTVSCVITGFHVSSMFRCCLCSRTMHAHFVLVISSLDLFPSLRVSLPEMGNATTGRSSGHSYRENSFREKQCPNFSMSHLAASLFVTSLSLQFVIIQRN